MHLADHSSAILTLSSSQPPPSPPSSSSTVVPPTSTVAPVAAQDNSIEKSGASKREMTRKKGRGRRKWRELPLAGKTAVVPWLPRRRLSPEVERYGVWLVLLRGWDNEAEGWSKEWKIWLWVWWDMTMGIMYASVSLREDASLKG